MLMGSVRYMGKRVREQKQRSNRGEEEIEWREVKVIFRVEKFS